jgi:hypothetical protein
MAGVNRNIKYSDFGKVDCSNLRNKSCSKNGNNTAVTLIKIRFLFPFLLSLVLKNCLSVLYSEAFPLKLYQLAFIKQPIKQGSCQRFIIN